MSREKPHRSLNRRTALKGLSLGSLSILGLGGSVVAKPGGGPPGTKGCEIVVPDDESTIQNGVNTADPGDTVCVKASGGPYDEQVVINKDLTLRGVDSPTVRYSSDPSAYTIPESGPTWEPIIFAFGGNESGGDVTGSGTVDVTVTGLVIDGADKQPDATRAAGILTRNVSGEVSDNTVLDMGVGGKETFGILTYGNSDLSILENEVDAYERGGIGAVGDGDAHPSPTADIRENTVIGSTGIGEAWGPNGIEIGFGAEGKIVNNEVKDNRYSGDGWVASGIIVFESNGVQVMRNSVTNSDVGIATGSWAWFLPTADNTKITKNEVHEANAGVLLQAVAGDGYSESDPSVSNNKVTNNEITDPDTDDEDTGVAIDAIDADPDFDPVVENNKVIRNTITGYAEQTSDDGTGSKIHAIEP